MHTYAHIFTSFRFSGHFPQHTGVKKNNPLWCSYANGARAAFLIDKDGYIQYTSEWFHGTDLEKAIHDVVVVE